MCRLESQHIGMWPNAGRRWFMYVRDVARGARCQVGGGGAVARLVELMLGHTALPERVPRCSYRMKGEVGKLVLALIRNPKIT